MQHIIKRIPSTPIGTSKHMAQCPACKDPAYTLLIEQGDGMIFLICKNECSVASIVYGAGLHVFDVISRWNYWRCLLYMGLVTVARKSGVKISAADREQERKAFVESQRLYKVGVEAHKREKEEEARELLASQVSEGEQGEADHGED